MVCNVCGETNNLQQFQINGDFGYHSELDSMTFEFSLCPSHLEAFLLMGSDTNSSFHDDDWTCLVNKYFDSKTISSFIENFRFVPSGYYNHTYNLYTLDEEQLMWTTKTGPLEVLTYDRILEIGDMFDFSYVNAVMEEKYPDQHNPFLIYDDDVYELFLSQLSKEELIAYVKKHSSKKSVYNFFNKK